MNDHQDRLMRVLRAMRDEANRQANNASAPDVCSALSDMARVFVQGLAAADDQRCGSLSSKTWRSCEWLLGHAGGCDP